MLVLPIKVFQSSGTIKRPLKKPTLRRENLENWQASYLLRTFSFSDKIIHVPSKSAAFLLSLHCVPIRREKEARKERLVIFDMIVYSNGVFVPLEGKGVDYKGLF